MKKLKLNLDALTVSTFDTAATAAGKGTVLGHSRFVSQNGTCVEFTCAADCSSPTEFEWTCWQTCGPPENCVL